MYTALYMPSLPEGSEDPTKDGFLDEDSAWEYIKKVGLCKGCLEDLERGFIEIGNGIEEDKIDCDHPISTMCGGEWFVVETEDRIL